MQYIFVVSAFFSGWVRHNINANPGQKIPICWRCIICIWYINISLSLYQYNTCIVNSIIVGNYDDANSIEEYYNDLMFNFNYYDISSAD